MVVIKGKVVSLDYEGKLEDGEIFDTSKHGDHSHPLEFEVGAGQVIPGFDEAVLGMEIGEEKEFDIEPKNAYGEYREELKRKVPKKSFQNPLDQQGNPVEPQAGMVLGMRTPQGQVLPVKIIDVGEEEITLDLNHPLAGKKLIFKIKILDIKEKSQFQKSSEDSNSLEDLTEK